VPPVFVRPLDEAFSTPPGTRGPNSTGAPNGAVTLDRSNIPAPHTPAQFRPAVVGGFPATVMVCGPFDTVENGWTAFLSAASTEAGFVMPSEYSSAAPAAAAGAAMLVPW